jgi:hypothetical protein
MVEMVKMFGRVWAWRKDPIQNRQESTTIQWESVRKPPSGEEMPG